MFQWSFILSLPSPKCDDESLPPRFSEQRRTQKDERVARFRRAAQDPDIYEKLSHSLAPSIWELGDVKKG